jgi:hypothetical protein
MRVRVVAYAPNDKAWKAVYQARRLHLEAEHISELRADSVPYRGVPHDLIARCDCAIVDHDLLITRLPIYRLLFIAFFVSRSSHIFVRGLK